MPALHSTTALLFSSSSGRLARVFLFQYARSEALTARVRTRRYPPARLMSTTQDGKIAHSAVEVDVKPLRASGKEHHVGSPPSSFRNPWPSVGEYGTGSPFFNAMKARWGPGRKIVPVPKDKKQLVQVRKPDWGAGKSGIKTTWFGHASFLVELEKAEGDRGIRILLDPVFSERMSPVFFAGPKRFVPLPCTLDDVPAADLFVISHNHYDHLDKHTVKAVYRKRGKGNIHFLCPLGIKTWLKGVGIAETDITELDWWQECTVRVPGVGSATLACTPAQHTSGRSLFDAWKTLWCSWVIASDSGNGGGRVFFAGDSGYRYLSAAVLASPDAAAEREKQPTCPAFREIGEKYGPFDLALLPIGCYLPRPNLSHVHCAPEDSIRVHGEVRSRKSIGMHYGTIRGVLSRHYEPVTAPPEAWKEACEAAGLKWGEDVGLCDIGETVVVGGESASSGEEEPKLG